MEQLKSLREQVAAMEQELARKEAEDPEAVAGAQYRTAVWCIFSEAKRRF